MATISDKRRPIRDRVDRSNELNRRISQIPSLREPRPSAIREGQKVSVEQRVDPAPTACRGLPKNSNRAIVRFGRGSGFLAWLCLVTVEIFSAEMARVVPSNRYPGANPKARSNRVT
jgi:hypothetical protein